jgi:hypothetical protein
MPGSGNYRFVLPPDSLTELERRAENESVFRRVNETIEAATVVGASTATFLCECWNPSCRQTLELPISEYEAVRRHSTRFIVAPGHEVSDEVSRVVEDRLAYSVVEKMGYAAALARASDARDPESHPVVSPEPDHDFEQPASFDGEALERRSRT